MDQPAGDEERLALLRIMADEKLLEPPRLHRFLDVLRPNARLETRVYHPVLEHRPHLGLRVAAGELARRLVRVHLDGKAHLRVDDLDEKRESRRGLGKRLPGQDPLSYDARPRRMHRNLPAFTAPKRRMDIWFEFKYAVLVHVRNYTKSRLRAHERYTIIYGYVQ